MNKLRLFFRDLRDRFRYREKISPEHIRTLAEELLTLAALAERLPPREEKRLARIQHINNEVSKLIDMTGRAEFHRLSAQRRLELRESLISSKEQILDSMSNSPTPTDMIQ